ncbi:hypothetical protein [Piscirickettsia litoralis]|uniref:Uncharacterized protein n=1 Tax=Piscirickettsia litoralis TaxID=1891921 RepID=A0ABX2ZY85_9GAMM|nr:hypothetical protein [Piscirickettsia litoralis]ODN41193.1 hypothetical protein BGC07_17420 [Piscirickettsia litoralis]
MSEDLRQKAYIVCLENYIRRVQELLFQIANEIDFNQMALIEGNFFDAEFSENVMPDIKDALGKRGKFYLPIGYELEKRKAGV